MTGRWCHTALDQDPHRPRDLAALLDGPDGFLARLTDVRDHEAVTFGEDPGPIGRVARR